MQVRYGVLLSLTTKQANFLFIIKNKVFAQDKHRLVKEEIQNKNTVYKRNTNKNIKTDTV
jgi:hypothetical protein